MTCTCTCHSSPATKADLAPILDAITALDRARSRDVKKLEKILMSDQDTLNVVAQALADLQTTVTSDDAGLSADATALEQEINALQNQPAGTPLDFTAVNSALQSLQGSVASNTEAIASVAALVPAPASPPADGSGDGS